MSKIIKKELSCDKYLFYCWLSTGSKRKRIRKKAESIVKYQIDNYLDF